MKKHCLIKILTSSLAICAVLSLFGCGENQSGSASGQNSKTIAENSVSDYKVPENTLGRIIASGSCGENANWELDENGLLTISGTGNMKDYSSEDVDWYSYRNDIKTAIVKNGITSIGDRAFFSCKKLNSITIPDSVTSIGDSAFIHCASLADINIPNNVTNIGSYAFSGCTSLSKITIPHSVTEIGFQTFYGWTSSQTIFIKGRSREAFYWSPSWDSSCDAKIVWNA